MGRPKSLTGRAPTTERLLAVAEEVFGRLGYVAARLEDIANGVGITRPSLLYHFRSKERLYAEVVRRAFAELRTTLEEAVEDSGQPFDELVENVVDAYQHFVAQRPALAAVLLREMVETRGPGPGLIAREIVPLLDWVERVVGERTGAELPDDLSVRAAVLQIATASLVEITASSEVRQALWPDGSQTLQLARILFATRRPP